MLRYLLVLVTACSFSPGATLPPAGADDDDDGSAIGPDASVGQQPTANCHVGDPTDLVLCLDFEDPSLGTGAIVDGAGHDARSTNVTVKAHDTQQGAEFASDNYATDKPVQVTNGGPDLDLTDDWTLTMWLWPMGTNSFSWAVKNPNLLGAGVNYDGTPFCYAGNGQYLDAKDALPMTDWHHLACVKTAGQLRLYVDAKRVACKVVVPAQTATNEGAIAGAGMIGGIDDIHLFSRPQLEAEIASDSGKAVSADPGNCP
ncbi:MAG: hypothetical protein QM831_28835 [Kofleriaceae bacterium]